MKENKYFPINCSDCGRFVGEGGSVSLFEDEYSGKDLISYAYCKKCLDKYEKEQVNEETSV